MLYLAERLNYFTPEKRDSLINGTNEISKIITGLIKSLSRKPNAQSLTPNA